MENITARWAGIFLVLTLAQPCSLYSWTYPWQEGSWELWWALLCQCCGCCGASCKETGIVLDSALSQPGCTPWAPMGFAAQVWEPHEPTQSSAGSEEQPWLRGSLGMLG